MASLSRISIFFALIVTRSIASSTFSRAEDLLAWLTPRGLQADCPPGKTGVRQRPKSIARASGRDDAFGGIEYLLLDLSCRDARDRTGMGLAAREDCPRDVVAPTPAAYGGMTRAHAITSIVIELACEK